MRSDDEMLYDPASEDLATETARVLDAATVAASISSTPTNQDDTELPSSSSLERPLRKRWFILEPAVFLSFLGMFLTGAVFQNLILYQSCTVVFHYNETQCQPLLGTTRETPEAIAIETEVQPYVAKFLMARSLIEKIVPAFVSLFIGPWSDKFGRRPILLSTFTGYLISACILTILTYISNKTLLSPWVFLLCSLPAALSGGTCALITGIYCYISDVATEKARASRMVLNEASLCAGMMIGNLTSGYIYGATNVLTVVALSTILLCMALAYVIFFVEESLEIEQIPITSKIREFFRFDLVIDLVRTCFERRPSFDRAIIWLVMISLTIMIFVMEGDSNVSYLFLRKKFEWTVKDFSLYGAARIVVQIVGSIIGMVILRKLLKFSIISLTMIAYASSVLESTVCATAVFAWELYIGMGLGLMRGIVGPMSRAILSHVAPPNEVGKIYALTTSLESISPLLAAPLYTIVYDATLTFYPGLYNFISAGLYLLCYAMIAVIFGIEKSLGGTTAYKAIGS